MARQEQPNQDAPPHSEQAELQNDRQLQSEFARALNELNKGEQTASALESGLDNIESKIEQLLAQAEEYARQQQADRTTNGSTTK